MRDLSALVVTDRGDRPETALFIALHRAGVRVKVLGWSDSPYAEWLEREGVPFVPLMLLGKRDRSGIEAIRWHLDDFRPSILHLMRKRPIFNGLAAAKGRPVKIVLYRGIVGNVSMLNPLDWMSFLNPRVDRIVCVAEAVRRSFLELGVPPFKLPPEKVVTIHKGHDLSWYRDAPLDLAVLGVPRGAFVVTCVANVRPRKGIPVLIRACDHLPAGLPIHVLLVGVGTASAEITRLIRRSPYRDRFHVLGFREDAPQIMAASDVTVLPSLRREGLPRSVIESMAYETTPIVTDAGGSPELVEHERSGLIVPAGDARALAAAILRLYVDRDACRDLGRNARRRIATAFTVERTAAQTLALYRELVSSSDPSGA
ncbi:MAG TPA: glycosyltransferase family 4 protein [Gammaproteobacteria bacterium]